MIVHFRTYGEYNEHIWYHYMTDACSDADLMNSSLTTNIMLPTNLNSGAQHKFRIATATYRKEQYFAEAVETRTIITTMIIIIYMGNSKLTPTSADFAKLTICDILTAKLAASSKLSLACILILLA